MLILNNADMEINEDLTIGFTVKEALELRKALEDIILKNVSSHSHIMSRDTDRELTVFVYSDDKVDYELSNESLSPKIKNLLNLRHKNLKSN